MEARVLGDDGETGDQRRGGLVRALELEEDLAFLRGNRKAEL